MDFLQLAGKSILIFGVANRKSVAWHIGRLLGRGRGHVRVRRAKRRRPEQRGKAVPDERIYVCDVQHEDQIVRLRGGTCPTRRAFQGMVHSLAFADFSGGPKPFHETPKRAFLQAVDISCFSLVALSNAMKDLLDPDASVVTISISTTRMASESYGYMAPIKAALDSSLAFLAKSFSGFSRDPIQRGGGGPAEDLGLGGHSRLRRRVPLRRTGDPAEAGRGNGRSGPSRRLSVEPAIERHQCPADRG